ncbi:MAG: TIGR03118 family protein, partial [Proteobacteria bacterium]
MSVSNYLAKFIRGGEGRKQASVRRPIRARLGIEALEGRAVPSVSNLFQQINLVSDQFGVALNFDPSLVNAWGISAAPSSGAFWVSSNGGDLSELYLGDVNGSAIQQPFKVMIPGGSPTGQVFNINQPIMGTGNSNDFSVTDGTNTGAAVFIFASKTGAISGWNPGVGEPIQTPFGPLSGTAEIGFQATDGAIYTGLAIGDFGTSHFLYAADFHNGKIDVLDGQFHLVTLGTNGFGSFSDPQLPPGYAPFNIQNLGGRLYVTYAQQDAARDGGSVAGLGRGFVDVYDTSGHLLQRVASGGMLNAPWGVAIAPSGFGSFGGDLLVGNFGDGHIDAYDPSHHYAFAGQLRGADGRPITISGLWGLQFGNGVSAGNASSLYFSAGPAHGTHGLFGSLSMATTVAISQFTGAGGALGLRVVTSGQSDSVTITDDPMAQTTTVVADGQTEVFDHTFAHFDLELQSKTDQVTFAIAGSEALSNQNLDILANLGTGENHFTFNPLQTDGEPADIFDNSNVNLNVVGHNGNDFVNISFDDISDSRVSVNVHGIGGGRTPDAPGTVRDSITFGHTGEIAGVRNSTVDVNVRLGNGDANFLFNDEVNLGHLVRDRQLDGPAAFGRSTMNVSILGSNRTQDVDNISLFANGVVNTASVLNFSTRLSAGNNSSFQGVLDADSFRIADDARTGFGGAANFAIEAGRGNDLISFMSINQDTSIELSGLLSLNILGGSGRDNVRIDLGGTGLSDSPTEIVNNRAMRLRIDGGSGNDTLNVNLANSPLASFDWDVALFGGSGRNNITFIGTNPVNGQPTFGPSGSVFIDAERGTADVFGNF